MRKNLVILLLLAVVAYFAYNYFAKRGLDANAILNTPKTLDLSVSCSDVTNLLVKSEVTVTVQNNSSRTHNDVTIRLIAYDDGGNVIKEITTTFDRSLSPYGSLSKPIILPTKTTRCDAVLESSNPN